MSFQEELEKLVQEIYFTGFQVGQYTQPSDETLEKRLNDSLTSIINLVDKEVPPRVEDATNDSRVPYIGGWSEGYNQAVDDTRNKLRDGE